MGCCDTISTICGKSKSKDEDKIQPKHLFLCFIAFVCLVLLYGAVICCVWARANDLKWQSTLKSSSYYADVKQLFRSAQLNGYFRWMHVLDEIQQSFADTNKAGSNDSVKPNKGSIDGVANRRVLGQDYQAEIILDERKERKANIERASKEEEITFVTVCIVVLIAAHFAFIIPFFVKFQIRFRARLWKLGAIYCLLGFCAVLGGCIELYSVYETNNVYKEYEDLAIKNGSKAAILVASCGFMQNEFTAMVRHQGLLELREKNHVCQDGELKLLASSIYIFVGLVYLVFFGILLHDYCYAMTNKIIPATEHRAMEVASRNAVMTEQSKIADEAMYEEERIRKLKEKNEAKESNKQAISGSVVKNDTANTASRNFAVKAKQN